MKKLSVLLTLAVILSSTAAMAAPKSELWPYWAAYDKSSSVTVDHGIWNELLSRHLSANSDGINRVDYAGILSDSRWELNSYINMLSSLKVTSLTRNEQRAYWINLYNALTVKVIIDNYPVDSIRDIDISPGLLSSGPWDAKFIIVEGKGVTLNDIEHRILRPIWKDARVHYALNCASIGCPNLQSVAYTADNTEGLLDKGARQYINHLRGVWFKDKRVYASSVYKWYKADFGNTDKGVIAHLIKYANEGLKAQLSKAKKISGNDYDWSLNGAK